MNTSILTDNCGVPGSNPGPATHESPANCGKMRSSGGAARALCRGRVNSRFKNRPLLAPLTVEGRVSWAGREAVRLVSVPGEADPGTRKVAFQQAVVFSEVGLPLVPTVTLL